MDSIDDVLEVLRQLGKKHGKVLSLSLVFSTLMRDRFYSSKEVIVNCLRALQKRNRIKPINFGIDIELLEDIETNNELNAEFGTKAGVESDANAGYVQSSLDVFKKRI